MNSGVPLSELKNKFLSEFKDFEAAFELQNQNGTSTMRREAIDQFDAMGFPTVKNEEWKYTNVSKYIDEAWHQRTSPVTAFADINLSAFNDFNAHRIVFTDGVFNPELSELKKDDPAITIVPFSEALISHKEIVNQYIGNGLPSDLNGFTALNAAFAADGIFIHVAKGHSPKYPVHIVFASGNGGEKFINHIRNLVIIEEGATLELIENWISSGNNEYLSNVVSETFVHENATLNQYRFQQENAETARQINFTQIIQQKHSLANNFTVTTGGKLVRNDLQYRLDSSHCESHLYGLYIGSGNQHIDNHTLVDHAMPDCFSNEFYKGIMAGQSAGVFNGKVIVRKDAQKTNAYQSNKNILLSDNAKINTKPQLEIFANDVKCSHGATTGQLDEEALFYLRSRGIGTREAKVMLTSAFAVEVLGQIKLESVKKYAWTLVEQKLNSLGNDQ